VAAVIFHLPFPIFHLLTRNRRNPETIPRNPKEAPLLSPRHIPRMNYHNSASRLSLPRLPAPTSTKEKPKAAPKKSLRPTRRRLATSAALALSCLCALRADAATQADRAHQVTPPVHPINIPTFLITLTGLSVILLRLPALWRHDFDC